MNKCNTFSTRRFQQCQMIINNRFIFRGGNLCAGPIGSISASRVPGNMTDLLTSTRKSIMASFKFLEKRALRFPQNKMEYNQRKRKIERKDKSSQSPMLNKKEEEEEEKKKEEADVTRKMKRVLFLSSESCTASI